MSNIGAVPEPIKHLYTACRADKDVLIGNETLPKQTAIALTVERIFVATLSAIAITAGAGLVIVGAIGIVISTPGAMVGAGSALIYYGVALLVESTASGVLLHSAAGCVATLAGFGMIQAYAYGPGINLGDKLVKRLLS